MAGMVKSCVDYFEWEMVVVVKKEQVAPGTEI
jgi:hypothetical protein